MCHSAVIENSHDGQRPSFWPSRWSIHGVIAREVANRAVGVFEFLVAEMADGLARPHLFEILVF